MSNTRRVESPSQPSAARSSTSETKKELQRRTKAKGTSIRRNNRFWGDLGRWVGVNSNLIPLVGTKGAKKDLIIKYMVKDEDQQSEDTQAKLTDQPPMPSSSRENPHNVPTATDHSMSSTEPAEAVAESSRSSGATANEQTKPSKKTTREVRKNRERGKTQKKKSERGGSKGSGGGGRGGGRRDGREHPQQEQRGRGEGSSRGEQRGRRELAIKNDEDFIPER